MSRLGYTLHALLREAAGHPDKATPGHRLAKGLVLSAKISTEGRPAICLHRDALTAPSRDEALTCARELGWPGPVITPWRTPQGYQALVLTRARIPDGVAFVPGLACAFLPELRDMPQGTLLGLMTSRGWATFMRVANQGGDEVEWCLMSGEHGAGSWAAAQGWLAGLEAQTNCDLPDPAQAGHTQDGAA